MDPSFTTIGVRTAGGGVYLGPMMGISFTIPRIRTARMLMMDISMMMIRMRSWSHMLIFLWFSEKRAWAMGEIRIGFGKDVGIRKDSEQQSEPKLTVVGYHAKKKNYALAWLINTT